MSNNEENSVKFSHPYLSISSLNKKFYGVYLKEEDRKWEKFLNATLEYSKEHKCWVLNVKSFKDFTKLLKNVEESSESESSTDDELIQKTLSRRLTSQQSSQNSIDDNSVSDSEMEDVVSLTRRIRYLLKFISVQRTTNQRLEDRVSKLEEMIEELSSLRMGNNNL
jgi:hypothetical protein